jgi:AcrR family transcriptional regulator
MNMFKNILEGAVKREPTAKSEATRERIMEAALQLFAEKGFEAATMREIAERSGCSVGLAYRYYRSKDAMALALYQRLLEEFAGSVKQVKPGNLAARWLLVTRAEFARNTPYRPALTGLINAGLRPGSATQVLGEESRPIRMHMIEIFAELVAGSNDLPRSADIRSLASLLYGVHLLLVLFWLQDPTPGQVACTRLIDLIGEALGWLKIASRLPGFGGMMQRLGEILRPILEGEAAATA